MENLNILKSFIEENDIEKAYEFIINKEDEYLYDSTYLNLKGMFCFKIQEYEIAINSYKKSIQLDETYLDSYFNLSYVYRVLGENIKAALYSGIALRYTDDEEFKTDIYSLYEQEDLYEQYKLLIDDIKNNESINCYNCTLFRHITNVYKDISEEFLELANKNNLDENWVYIKDDFAITNKEILTIDNYIERQEELNLTAIVLYDIKYIEFIRELAMKGLKSCSILAPTSINNVVLVEVTEDDMNSLRNKDYEVTVTLNLFNAADGNVFAMIKHMPEKYKGKYKLNIIKGRDVYSLENMVKVPLISSVTVGGFNTFDSYSNHTYNIEVGHGSIGFKSCGLMDKKHKGFSFTPDTYKNVAKVFVISQMEMLLLSSFSAIPENKYEITGNPRTDMLLESDGREKLEYLLDRDLNGKKIVFNMPTFRIHENSGLTNGDLITDGIKIKNFDYVKFDKFLKEQNTILISKVHHAEERLVTSKMKKYQLENIIFISNNDLENKELNLYEVLNCCDILITDYSSIYGDFLFMDKSIIFTNYDIEQYRNERGIILEPYDYWTAGPKVKNQEDLELEIVKCLKDKNYYKEKRAELREVFYKYQDSNSTLRAWDHIDKVLNEKYNISCSGI